MFSVNSTYTIRHIPLLSEFTGYIFPLLCFIRQSHGVRFQSMAYSLARFFNNLSYCRRTNSKGSFHASIGFTYIKYKYYLVVIYIIIVYVEYL